MKSNVKIVALGSTASSDDALALEALKRLKSLKLPEEVKLVEADRNPSKLISEVESCDKLIVIDAVRIGSKPGTLHRIRLESIKPSRSITLHNIDTATLLKLALTLASEKPRKVVIIGLEPYRVDPGEKLTPEVEEGIEKLVEEVLKEVSMRNT
ncbi:MAG: hydrogenase maturation protease [Candidatus Bathyarchaeota archaeon]|nr:hydrogenase maturation protease [Candidatus Bathyarchaeota archaeon]